MQRSLPYTPNSWFPTVRGRIREDTAAVGQFMAPPLGAGLKAANQPLKIPRHRAQPLFRETARRGALADDIAPASNLGSRGHRKTSLIGVRSRLPRPVSTSSSATLPSL